MSRALELYFSGDSQVFKKNMSANSQPSVPHRDKGSYVAMNLVDGMYLPTQLSQETTTELQRHWVDLPGDVYIVTYPKSGTTWTQQITKLIRNNGVQDDVDLADSIKWLTDKGLAACKDTPSPRSFKSHDTYQMISKLGGEPATSPAKYIYIARNPKDVAVSYFHHTSLLMNYEFTGDFECYLDHFMAGQVPYRSWFDHVLHWWKFKDCKNILYLKYEDMKSDLPKTISTIASFIGYNNLEASTISNIAKQCSVETMKENPRANCSWSQSRWRNDRPPFIRKGIVGDWRNYFTAERSRSFDEEYTRRMEGSGLEFNFD